jgi:hypothetical protein
MMRASDGHRTVVRSGDGRLEQDPLDEEAEAADEEHHARVHIAVLVQLTQPADPRVARQDLRPTSLV